MGEALLAVDLGKTYCRAAVFSRASGAPPAAVGTGPGAPGLADPHGVGAALAAIRAALPAEAPREVVVGAAGALAAPRAAQALADELARLCGAASVTVTSDAVLAHAGALGGAPGVVLVVGTGAVAIGLDADGRLELADGAGPWLGDEGGGAWIGLAGLRAAVRAGDGRGRASELQAAASARFGDVAALPRRLGTGMVPGAASFAPDVAAAAADGDEVAGAILAAAANALATTARAAHDRLVRERTVSAGPPAGRAPAEVPGAEGPSAHAPPADAPRADAPPADAPPADAPPADASPADASPPAVGGVVITGGLVALGEPLLAPLRAALAPLELRPATGSPLDGAPVIARGDGPHSAHAIRARPLAPAGHPLDGLATEAVRAGLEDLDARPVGELVELLVDAEGAAHGALRRTLPALTTAAEAIAERLAAGGRLRYVGAGTSGRIALQDAAEIAPTFGTDPDLVIAVMAGGAEAAHAAREGAEDDAAAGGRDLAAAGVTTADAVVGLSASGRTPYVLGALRAAREAGALTVAIANAPGGPLAAAADLAIEIETGAEVLAGSTRLTAGTTQKVALNAISTAAMIRLGKAYGPWMVDVRAGNEKLRRRAVRIVAAAAQVDEDDAQRALDEAGGHAKTAIVALLAGVGPREARERLTRAGGHVRAAVG